MQYIVYICCIFEEVLRVLCNAMFIYDLHSRKSSEFYAIQCLYMMYIRGSPQSFMQYNVYICFTFEEVLRVLCNTMFIYDLHSRESSEFLCNTMFIYDLHSRKSSEFHAIQCLYMIYIRVSPQSFMQYNVYI